MEPSTGLALNPNAVHAIYLILCVALAAAAHTFSFFDMRGVGRVRRRAPLSADDAEFDRATQLWRAQAKAEALHVTPRADLQALTVGLILLGVILAASAGFLAPRILAPLLSGVSWDRVTSDFTVGAPERLGRIAQVIGAVCFAAIALRMAQAAMAAAAIALVAGVLGSGALFVAGEPVPLGLFAAETPTAVAAANGSAAMADASGAPRP